MFLGFGDVGEVHLFGFGREEGVFVVVAEDLVVDFLVSDEVALFFDQFRGAGFGDLGTAT